MLRCCAAHLQISLRTLPQAVLIVACCARLVFGCTAITSDTAHRGCSTFPYGSSPPGDFSPAWFAGSRVGRLATDERFACSWRSRKR